MSEKKKEIKISLEKIINEKKFPLLIEREDCWFFDMKCMYPKTEQEIEHEIEYSKREYEEEVFSMPYLPIYPIPHPDMSSWCSLCMSAMNLREADPALGHGKPRREEER